VSLAANNYRCLMVVDNLYPACAFTLEVHAVPSSVVQLQTFNAMVDAPAVLFSHWPTFAT